MGNNASGTDAQSGSHTRHLATLLPSKAKPVSRGGKELYELPVAVTGEWVKSGRKFAITEADLANVVSNFCKRKNEQVVVDYEHASEMPQVALGGPVPAAGWIHELSVVGNPGTRVRLQEEGDPPAFAAESRTLLGMVEWTPDALGMIQRGAYRFFSPAIDWECRDKETGAPQGATLTSGALTNHPFLEELPPIMLSDLARAAAMSPKAAHGTSSNLDHRGASSSTSAFSNNPEWREAFMQRLQIRKLTDGTYAGHHAICNGESELGYVDADDLSSYARGEIVLDSTLALSDAPGAALAARIGVDPGTTFEDIRRLLADRGGSAAESRVLLLSEAVSASGLDHARAAQLARDGKITLDDFIGAQQADRRIDDAIRSGKILPRDRQFFFRDALERPGEFAQYIRQAGPVVRLGSMGIGSGGPMSVDDEVRARTEQVMAEESMNYARALKKVLASDRELERRYHAAHRREIGLLESLGDAGITH
jgi:phage I-like protein